MMELELRRLTSSAGGGAGGVLPSDGEVGGSTLDEAIEARMVVERAIVRLAAYRRTDADLDRLAAALELMETAGDDRVAFNRGDFAFHLALSQAAHNALLASTLASLHGPVRRMIAFFSDGAFREGRVDDLVDAHARLAHAVTRQDADKAPTLVTEMLNRLREEASQRDLRVAPTLSMVGQSARVSKGERP